MDNYLISIGIWNFAGSLFVLTFLNEKIGHSVLVNWSQIFTRDYTINYYGKIWLIWLAGLNIFFGVINLLSTKWALIELKEFIIYFDIIAYLLFILLGIWGLKTKNCGPGIYGAFAIFLVWIIWGCLSL